MADNKLYIPDLNPLRFYENDPDTLPQYLSKHFDAFPFVDQQKPWEHNVKYCQKWQTSDVIYLQFQSNFSPIQVELVDRYGIPRVPTVAIPVRANKYLPGYYVYEVAISLAGVAPGVYIPRLTAGDPAIVTMFSEPLIIAVTHKNTLLLEYRNSTYHGNVIFETQIKFGLRVEGRIKKLFPNRNSTIYEDEIANPTVLKSSYFRTHELKIGGSLGIPDWMVDKFGLLWTCNSVLIDGKSFAATGDSKEEFTESERYAMRGITMIVREGVNSGSKVIGADLNQDLRMIVVHNIDAKSFGDLYAQGASNIIPITHVE